MSDLLSEEHRCQLGRLVFALRNLKIAAILYEPDGVLIECRGDEAEVTKSLADVSELACELVPGRAATGVRLQFS